MSRQYLRAALVLTVLALALVVAGAAVAAKGGTSGAPPDKGGGHTETASNNLSVPTIMIGAPIGVPDVGNKSLVYPSGTPLTGYELDPAAYYFVQGTHTWQAEWTSATFATGTAEWGDNLAGDAKLKVGQPIRVELGLFDDTGLQMSGFNVVKLEPSELDRVSAYGTSASSDDDGVSWYATAELLPVRIYDADVTFSVKNVATGEYVVPETDSTAEVNATGKVVYGYNLRVSAVGEYEITFTIPNVDISGVDDGTFESVEDGPDSVTLSIDVIPGGGGGGGGH